MDTFDRNRFVSPYRYALLAGLTCSAVYNRIKRGNMELVSLVDEHGDHRGYIDLVKYEIKRRKYERKPRTAFKAEDYA